MRKEEIECIGVDVSKNTLDVALFRGKIDWNEGHVKVSNNESGYKELREVAPLEECREETSAYLHGIYRALYS